MSFLGFIIILISVSVLIADPILEKFSANRAIPIDLIKDNRKWILVLTILLGILLMINPFVYNADGERTYVQDPWLKTEKVIFEPGYTWGGFFHRSTEWPDVMSTVLEDIPIRFDDATQAKADANVRWELPKEEQTMINLHKSYRSPDKLQTRTLEPYSKECLGFASQLMESEVHYSGGQSKLKEDFRDQLLNGQYVLETNTSFVFDSLSNEKVKITNVDLRRDENGRIMTIPSDVQTYGIKAVFAAVPHIDYEPIVDEKLKAKIEQSTKESIAKQALITAQQEALTAKAKGEEMLAQTRAEEEADKLRAVIRAEKEKAVAKEQAEQAKYVADKVEQEGRAKAAANQALVNAGLTPQEAAEWDYKKHVDGMKALSDGIKGASWPSVMQFGVETGVSNPMEAIGVDYMLNVADRLEKQNKKKN